MDMRTSIFSYGAPEMTLMVEATAQMARFYNLPFFVSAGCTGAKFCDAQGARHQAIPPIFLTSVTLL